MNGHPVQLRVEDDLRRSRLTVFVRLLLAIPHFIWLGVWTALSVILAFVAWVAALVKGQVPDGLHRVLTAYIRYTLHVNAYVFLAANPYPPFFGEPNTYPVDLEIEPPKPQSRWSIAFRAILAIPALLFASALAGPGGNLGGGRLSYYAFVGGGLLVTVGVLGWFAILVRGAIPSGLRDLALWSLRYVTQADAYLFLLTDAYPNSNPDPPLAEARVTHPIWMKLDHADLRRSRLTVFFRFLLAFPHFVWLTLWGIAVFVTAVASWIATLVRGTPPAPLHRFHSAYVRYVTHVNAFVYLVGNPFPGFTGAAGTYPVELQLPARSRQNRWKTGFRALLAFPAFVVASTLGNVLFLAGVLAWFYALVTARMPRGLRNAGAYVLRYNGQTFAYALLLTDAYPHSGPWQIVPTSEPAAAG